MRCHAEELSFILDVMQPVVARDTCVLPNWLPSVSKHVQRGHCIKSFFMIILVAKKLFWLPIVSMEDANLT